MENPNSPEFEFWISSQQTTLHSADELFSDGVLLPLRLLTTDDPVEVAVAVAVTNPPQSKRWKDIFRKKPQSKDDGDKKKKKERITSGTAELNINLWPFSRSRSAGSRPRTLPGNRKVSSAPCSRSNSTGRKWPTSPVRPGLHLGRSSPVWQAKRRSLHDTVVRNTAEKASRSTAGGKVLNVNVSTCIGYRQRMRSCQSDVSKETDETPVAAAGEAAGPTALFNFRSLFTKKVF